MAASSCTVGGTLLPAKSLPLDPLAAIEPGPAVELELAVVVLVVMLLPCRLIEAAADEPADDELEGLVPFSTPCTISLATVAHIGGAPLFAVTISLSSLTQALRSSSVSAKKLSTSPSLKVTRNEFGT